MTPETLDDTPVRPETPLRGPDKVFRQLATAAAGVSFVIVGLTIFFLVDGSRAAFRSTGIINFFTRSVWQPSIGKFGAFGLLIGTIIIATIALIVAIPLAVAMALFINEYAPRVIRRPMTSIIDLLAALPSLLFGMWGKFALQDRMVPVAKWLSQHLSFLIFFRLTRPGVSLVESSMIAGFVVGIMIVPIITSVSRDVMAQVPREQCEGALALGGTRWGMIRSVILPFGRSGIVGATLLGFGRALGETIAVTLILASPVVKSNIHVLQAGAGTIAAQIADEFGTASTLERSALVAAGLALFLLTLVVNLAARSIVKRSSRLA